MVREPTRVEKDKLMREKENKLVRERAIERGNKLVSERTTGK